MTVGATPDLRNHTTPPQRPPPPVYRFIQTPDHHNPCFCPTVYTLVWPPLRALARCSALIGLRSRNGRSSAGQCRFCGRTSYVFFVATGFIAMSVPPPQLAPTLLAPHTAAGFVFPTRAQLPHRSASVEETERIRRLGWYLIISVWTGAAVAINTLLGVWKWFVPVTSRYYVWFQWFDWMVLGYFGSYVVVWWWAIISWCGMELFKHSQGAKAKVE